ncbi:hypothetical protein VFPBJ_11727 [Purpureocillium lilacinum]|uniref:Uncharacterized protein n=1 Tax=Purpureocillium lilacinum TaxID=33203 RepID=A0A179EXQ0_PURLI|nr:hypothetical protein VFPBJ_11727 [Purpureocillium lilacinum]
MLSGRGSSHRPFPVSGSQALPALAASVRDDRLYKARDHECKPRSSLDLLARIFLRLGRHRCRGLHPRNQVAEMVQAQREGKTFRRNQRPTSGLPSRKKTDRS